MSNLNAPPPQPKLPLYKQKSWSPDLYREEAWLKRKGNYGHHRRTKSVTDEDVDELKACIELGFGFDYSPEVDPRLSHTLPALGLYYAVNKHYYDTLSNSNSSLSSSSSLSSWASSEGDIPSPLGSPHTILCPGNALSLFYVQILEICSKLND